MEIKVYNYLPDEAMEIRIEVFVREQGFSDHPDDTDKMAHHLVGYIDGAAVATCRIFASRGSAFSLGRLAVLPAYRQRGIGRALLCEAERVARDLGAECLMLHAQAHAEAFYLGAGYTRVGDTDYEQGRAHVHMIKIIN